MQLARKSDAFIATFFVNRFCSSAKCLVFGGNPLFRLMKPFRSNEASSGQPERNEAEEQTPPTRGEENRGDQRGD